MLLRLLARALEHLGFEVTAKGSSPAALQCLTAQPFDLLVTDFRMPILDGLQLLRCAVDQHVRVPAIVVSGSPELTGRSFARDLGVVAFLKKPFSLANLQASALRAVEGRHGSVRLPAEGDQTW
jgi:CheY-like chemotaxis protein